MRARLLITSILLYASASPGEEINNGATRIVEAAPGVYAVEPVFAGANASFIVNDEFVTVVDSHGSPASAAALVDVIRTVTDSPVRYVVNSHWHVDHHSGNRAYEAAWPAGVTFISHHTTREDIPDLGRQQFIDTENYRSMPAEQAQQQLQTGLDAHGMPLSDARRETIGKFAAAQRDFVAEGNDYAFRLADLTLDRELVIHGEPNRHHVLFLHPAHTRGDLVVWLPDTRVLIVSDILTKPILWTWSAYPSDYVKTLVALEALEPQRIIIGHGGPVLEGVDYLRTAHQFLQAVLAAVEPLVADGSEDDAVARALADDEVRGFHARFGGDAVALPMFEQMVSWTAARALLDLRGEL